MDVLEPKAADELLSACRTTVSDELRSITYFTEEAVEEACLRSDLDRTAGLMGFAECRYLLNLTQRTRG